jgi:hypothetical protein
MDALAIALVLYLHRRWGLIFLVAGIFATALGALSQVPAISGADLGVLAPIVEKATGISSWVAQLEQVVVSHQSTFYGMGTLVLLSALTVVQALALIDAFKRWGLKLQSAVKTSRSKGPSAAKPKDGPRRTSATETPIDLWKETDPTNL